MKRYNRCQAKCIFRQHSGVCQYDVRREHGSFHLTISGRDERYLALRRRTAAQHYENDKLYTPYMTSDLYELIGKNIKALPIQQMGGDGTDMWCTGGNSRIGSGRTWSLDVNSSLQTPMY
jgi:hypothetical protein